MTAKVLILACGALAHELVELKRRNQWEQVQIQCLPAELHNTPKEIPFEVRDALQRYREEFENIFVAYADCGTGGLLDPVLEEFGVNRLPGAHCYEFFAGAEGSGIPQTLIAIEGRGGRALADQLLSFRIAIGKVLLTVMGLFAGASIGREGPTVHLGAAIMYSLGRYVHLPARYLERGLIMTGGGAGIAAAFNTPLAGIVFAIEEMARSFDRRNSSMILIGVILAGMTAIYVHQDNYNYYGTSPVDIDFSWVWLGVVVCGVTDVEQRCAVLSADWVVVDRRADDGEVTHLVAVRCSNGLSVVVEQLA